MTDHTQLTQMMAHILGVWHQAVHYHRDVLPFTVGTQLVQKLNAVMGS
jgi:hypothetical protein